MNKYKNLDQTKHGLYKHPLNHIWAGIRQRCNNPKSPVYHRYGGRGIKISNEWNDFKSFYDWAISKGWTEGLQIDRENNDGDYTPDNCRLVTAKVNSNNRRDNVKVEFKGETLPLSIACDRVGLKLEAVRQYMRRSNKTFEQALNSHYHV